MLSVISEGVKGNSNSFEYHLPETLGEKLDFYSDILNKNFVVLSPGGAKPFRRWPIDNFLELADRFHNQGVDVVIIGDNQEKNMLDGRKDELPEDTLNLIGETNLEQLVSLIRKAKIVVANDSGPMHLANALNVPVVGIFGSGDVVRTRPYLMEKARIVESPPMDCKPCYQPVCNVPLCMHEITVERVWKAVSDLL
jgi:lipopolysaccharide heptosyltransferase II